MLHALLRNVFLGASWEMPIYVLQGQRATHRPGWAVYLRLAILALLLAISVGLLIFIGLAFALVGAGISIVAALVYAVRGRWLKAARTSAPAPPQPTPEMDATTEANANPEVRVIEVDEIIVRR